MFSMLVILLYAKLIVLIFGIASSILQRGMSRILLCERSIRLIVNKSAGETLALKDIQFQRPCPNDAISVNDIDTIIGKELLKDIECGDCIRKEHIKW